MATLRKWAMSMDVNDMLDDDEVGAQALRACTFASAFVNFEKEVDSDGNMIVVDAEITLDTELSRFDWGLISPLFALYCQRKVALMLEASRPLQVEVFGRSVGEIDSEIRQLEDDYSRRTFMEQCSTI